MSNRQLIRDTRWEIFYGDISFEQFASEKVPNVSFKEAVPKDVKEAFGIVNKLLSYAYYEYLFVDMAVARALQIFEMALLLRYKELNNGEEWDLVEKPLRKLLGWFYARHYFERNDYQFIEAIRQMRNHFTHPKSHNFGGSTFFPWIYTIADLINGLYENIELRQQRWTATNEFQKKLITFLKKGGKLKYLDRVYYIYDIGPLKVDNRIIPTACYFTLLPIFKIESSEPKMPIVLGYPHEQLKLEASLVDFTWGAGKLTLSNELTDQEQLLIEDFRTKIKSDFDYLHQNISLLHDAGKFLRQEIKKALDNSL